MSDSLCTLGDLVFRFGGVHADAVELEEEWRHVFQESAEGEGTRSFHGIGPKLMTIPGEVFPGHYGDLNVGEQIRELADSGEPQLFIKAGRIFGRYVILGFREVHTEFFPDGTPRRITYAIRLRKDPE